MQKILALFVLLVSACAPPTFAGHTYKWEQLLEHAPYPESYNWPVHVTSDGRFVALHPRGTWESRDGVRWETSSLPFSGTNSAYLALVQHDGATWALGAHDGNYLAFTIRPTILRTRDHANWENLGASPTLPPVIFYGAASFSDALWIVGGYRDGRENGEVWRSTDGLNWIRVVDRAPWTPRANPELVTFRGRLYLLGGGAIDGPSANDVWSTADGLNWRRETPEIAPEHPIGFTAIVFDDRIWLLGANRSGRFSSEMLVSGDGRTWRAERAPWSPRGGIGAWTDGDALYITGGKYSVEHNGEHRFSYSNDVWRMRRRP